MTSPAEELRAAAARLRELATAASTATATPVDKGGKPTTHWHFNEREQGSGYLYAANPDGPGTRLIHSNAGRGTYPHMRTRHGEYAAAMDPAVGLANASLLEAAAGLIDDHPDLTRPHVTDEPCSDHACRIVHAALAVARQINGGGQP